MITGLTIKDIEPHLKQAKRNPRGIEARCPAHDDKKPSFFARETIDGNGVVGLVVKCSAGCEFKAIVDGLKAAGVVIPRRGHVHSDVRQVPVSRSGPKAPAKPDTPPVSLNDIKNDRCGFVAMYPYTAMDGTKLLKVRFKTHSDGKKNMSWFRAVDDLWVEGAGGRDPGLYRRDLLEDAAATGKTVFIVEGEKDADSLVELGLVAVSGPHGSNTWKPEYSKAFHGVSKIVILADSDESGRAHARRVADSLAREGHSVYLHEFEELPEKSDVSDWMEIRTKAGRDLPSVRDELLVLVEKTPIFEPIETGESSKGEQELRRLHVVRWREVHPDFSAPELVADWIGLDALGVICGSSGTAKTFFSLDLAFHIARGLTWHNHRVMQGIVVYVAAEAPSSVLRRVFAIKLRNDLADVDVPLHVVPEPVNLLRDDLDVEALIRTVDDLAKEDPVRAIFIDTLAQVAVGGDKNTFETMTVLASRLSVIRQRTGAAVLVIHHAGKDDTRGARGHSSLKAHIDTEIEIRIEGDHRVATLTKSRDGEIGRRVGFDLDEVEVGKNDRGEPVKVGVVTHLTGDEIRKPLEGDKLEAYQALLSVATYRPGGRVEIDLWRRSFIDVKIKSGAKENSARRSFNRCLKKLSPGWVTIDKDKVFIREAGTRGGVPENDPPGQAVGQNRDNRKASLLAVGTSGTKPGQPVTCPTQEPGGTTGTHPFRGVPVSRPCPDVEAEDESAADRGRAGFRGA